MILRTLIVAIVALAYQTGLAEEQPSLTVERLTWAGVKMVAGETTVLIDAVGTDLWDGNAPGGFVPVTSDTRRTYALVTHTHNDHLDIETLQRVLGNTGYIIAPAQHATHLSSRGLRVITAELYEPVSRGGFTFIAVPAVDGFGADQVSWIVSVDSRRFLHAGDTLWHGKWADFGAAYGPFDAAFLPINGARLQSEPSTESAGTMTPGQAVDVALQLRAQKLVPIHFGLNDPPFYTEVERPLETLLENARRRNVEVSVLSPGEVMELP